VDTTPASVVAPGAVVDGHLIEAVLGSGGVGTVCVARQVDSGHRVALKVLNAAVSGDPAYRRRFAEEVRAARSLHHPNIVAVYGHGETPDGILWMAMQYVHGTDADRELRAGRMPPQRVAHIIAEVAKALDYVHTHDVVHGDVKPPNFLLGHDDTVVLADFGLARGTEDQAVSGEGGFVLTSAAYASPEMLRGRVVDARADVYSLGCSLFRLLTGKPPFFDAASKAEVVDGQLHRPVPPATRYAPWLPGQIDSVITTATAKEPAARYPSAGQLARAAIAALDRESPC
jgi:serine/threonine protein kinase